MQSRPRDSLAVHPDIARQLASARPRNVSGGIDKFCKLLVGHDGLIHPEAIDMNANMRFCVRKPLYQSAANGQPWLDIIGRLRLRRSPHPKLTPGNPDHVFRSIGRLALL
jgi:hypothetical protein